MEDKDFLGYFNKLGPPSNLQEIKSSASKILATLLALDTVAGRKASQDSSANKNLHDKAEQMLK